MLCSIDFFAAVAPLVARRRRRPPPAKLAGLAPPGPPAPGPEPIGSIIARVLRRLARRRDR